MTRSPRPTLSDRLHRIVAVAEQLQVNYPGLRQIVVNTGWLFTDNILRLVSAVLVNAWVVRYLGPKQYGDLSYALAFVMLFTPLATLGLTGIVVRDLVQTPDEAPETLGTAFALMLGGSGGATVLASLAIFVIRPHDALTHRLVIVLAAGLLFQAFTVFDAWFQSQVLSKYTVYARNMALFVVGVIKIGCVLVHAPLLTFGIIYTLESGLYALGLIIVFRHRRLGKKSFHGWQIGVTRAKSLLRDSWPLLFQGLAIMVYMRIDQTMLRQMLPGDEGRQAVGLYAAAVRLSEIWFFIPMAITSSVFPAIVRSRNLGEIEYHGRIQRLFNTMVIVSYTVAIPMTLLSRFIVTLFYGNDYRDAAPMFAILAWAGVWVSLGLARGAIIQAENRQILSFKASVLGATSNVLLNLLLIPPLGGIGSALATVISYGISDYVSSFLFPFLVHLGKMQTSALIYPNPFKERQRE